jgi:hypothetical protein
MNKQDGGSTTSEVGSASPLQLRPWNSGRPVSRTGLTQVLEICPLSEINNAVLKSVVAKMSEQGLSPKTIDNYVPVVKMVVASVVDEQGEEIYPRKWNHEFIDLPVVEKDRQNTPSFSSEVMTGLARWKRERERMIFVLCGAGGFRVGEALGIEIDKHILSGFPDHLYPTENSSR